LHPVPPPPSRHAWSRRSSPRHTRAERRPSQRHGWSIVSIDKLGSWFLLLIISYTLVSLINAPRAPRGARAEASPRPVGAAISA